MTQHRRSFVKDLLQVLRDLPKGFDVSATTKLLDEKPLVGEQLSLINFTY